MEKDFFNKIKTEEEAIETLKRLYIGMSEQRIIFDAKQEGNQKVFKQYQKQTQKMIDDMLNYVDISNHKKIELLEIFIENVINQELDSEIKDKIKSIYGEYYQILKAKIQEIENYHKEDKELNNQLEKEKALAKQINDETKVLNLIRDSSVKIYEDKSEKEEYRYGELIQEREKESELLYRDKHMALIKLETYQTQKVEKSKNSESRILTSLVRKEVCKYEYQIEDTPNHKATIQFFASPELATEIKRKNLNYLPPMLAAILKAKEEGREHIGDITIIDKQLNTAVTQYDDDLEISIKNLKQKEEKESGSKHRQEHLENVK